MWQSAVFTRMRGIDPSAPFVRALDTGLPRMRDRPLIHLDKSKNIVFTRMRGSTSFQKLMNLPNTVYPACAGSTFAHAFWVNLF